MAREKAREGRGPLVVRCLAVDHSRPEQQQQASAQTGTVVVMYHDILLCHEADSGLWPVGSPLPGGRPPTPGAAAAGLSTDRYVMISTVQPKQEHGHSSVYTWSYRAALVKFFPGGPICPAARGVANASPCKLVTCL
jgi:hypothetical protein